MKGYKGMNSEMKCRGMQFEVGKTYHVDGEISVCRNGLHFCERLTDVFDYYGRDGNRFFVVEAHGCVMMEGSKSAASDLTVVRELTDVEINRTLYSTSDGSNNGTGYGYGHCYGNGYRDGIGTGCGDGNGYGDGNGNGYGNGYGDGTGYSYGNLQNVLLFV